jgi:inner membrane protein involved in colicin E2 resistance
VTSVLGSALATALAIHVGFRLTLFVAALVYAAVGALFLLASRRAAAAPATLGLDGEPQIAQISQI